MRTLFKSQLRLAAEFASSMTFDQDRLLHEAVQKEKRVLDEYRAGLLDRVARSAEGTLFCVSERMRLYGPRDRLGPRGIEGGGVTMMPIPENPEPPPNQFARGEVAFPESTSTNNLLGLKRFLKRVCLFQSFLK
jgi:hypothetical protein